MENPPTIGHIIETDMDLMINWLLVYDKSIDFSNVVFRSTPGYTKKKRTLYMLLRSLSRMPDFNFEDSGIGIQEWITENDCGIFEDDLIIGIVEIIQKNEDEIVFLLWLRNTNSYSLIDNFHQELIFNFCPTKTNKNMVDVIPSNKSWVLDPTQNQDYIEQDFEVPTRTKDFDNWVNAYRIIKKTRSAFRKRYSDSFDPIQVPKIEDFSEAIKRDMGWDTGERTIRRIIKAGDAGKLD